MKIKNVDRVVCICSGKYTVQKTLNKGLFLVDLQKTTCFLEVTQSMPKYAFLTTLFEIQLQD